MDFALQRRSVVVAFVPAVCLSCPGVDSRREGEPSEFPPELGPSTRQLSRGSMAAENRECEAPPDPGPEPAGVGRRLYLNRRCQNLLVTKDDGFGRPDAAEPGSASRKPCSRVPRFTRVKASRDGQFAPRLYS